MKTRICTGCKKEKELTTDNFYKNVRQTGGFNYYCRECSPKLCKNWYEKNKDKHNKKKQLRLYNLTEEEYNCLLLKQKNLCAICKKELPRIPHIDHDHNTKKVRGLLHRQCNLLLGSARESISMLQNAIEYLKRNGEKNVRIFG